MLDLSEIKRMAACKAVDDHVTSGMVIGLGTGSTAYYAVQHLGDLLKSGKIKDIKGVTTSSETEEIAKSFNIPLTKLEECRKLDVCFDGADQVSNSLDLIKGRGGALLIEKLVESHTKKFICVVDSSKLAFDDFGFAVQIPVEIINSNAFFIAQQISKLPCFKTYNIRPLPDSFAKGAKIDATGKGSHRPTSYIAFRSNSTFDSVYKTDSGNFLIDLFLDKPIENCIEMNKQLKSVVGVIETGLFLGMTHAVYVGYHDGNVRVITN